MVNVTSCDPALGQNHGRKFDVKFAMNVNIHCVEQGVA